MCGIALIISGVPIDSSSLLPESGSDCQPLSSPAPESKRGHKPILRADNLKECLLRRGPDHLGSQKVFLGATTTKSVAELHFLGATLQLRGISPVHQPLVDTTGNILVYNGEIFGGIDVGIDNNDTERLMHELENCCSCDCHGHKISCHCFEEGHISVPELLSTIKGPWALVYWQARSKTIWFGRDAFGRRSLLAHWPTLDDARFLLSSVSPISSAKMDSGSASASDNFELNEGFEVADGTNALECLAELPCGIYSIRLDVSEVNWCESQDFVGEVRKHEWTDPQLKKLINWERTFIEPKSDEFHLTCEGLIAQDMLHSTYSNGKHFKVGVLEDQRKPLPNIPDSFMNGAIRHSSLPAQKVLLALRESVMRRTALNPVFQATFNENREENLVPVALLFSGGLDSMILAALLDQCLDARYEIDLLNVSFDGQLAPDRISARAGLRELQRITPRRWRLVEIDADLSTLTSETKHVMSLIFPAKTYMDLNIGIALWLAAGGDGWVDDGIFNHQQNDHQRLKYKSEAKILLVGSGADEQCAGYSRHKTKYRSGGWRALGEEMKLDMQRIWKRNLGRDDRCISDNGKEARFPFLDEDVIATLLEIPLWEIADLDQPSGKGDKRILREVARLLGLEEAANLPKRAIQNSVLAVPTVYQIQTSLIQAPFGWPTLRKHPCWTFPAILLLTFDLQIYDQQDNLPGLLRKKFHQFDNQDWSIEKIFFALSHPDTSTVDYRHKVLPLEAGVAGLIPVWVENSKRIKSKELWEQPCGQPGMCRKCCNPQVA